MTQVGRHSFPSRCQEHKLAVITERCVFVPMLVSGSRRMSAFAAAPHMPLLSLAKNIVYIFPTPCRD